MKYRLLLLGMFFSISIVSVAQSDTVSVSPWSVDLALGVNQSKMSGSEMDFMQNVVTSHGDGDLVTKSRTGLDAALLFRRSLGTYFHFKTGLQYMQRGATLENTSYVEKPAMSSDYVGVPIMLGAHTAKYKQQEQRVGLFVESGLSYLLNASDHSSTWIDKTYPIWIVIEMGAEVRVASGLMLGVRYKFMKDLTHAYTVARQYDPNNLALTMNYGYYYSTNTFSISLRQKL